MNSILSYFNINKPVPKEEPKSMINSALTSVIEKIPKHDRIPEQIDKLALKGLEIVEHLGSGLSKSGLRARSFLRGALFPLILLEFPLKLLNLEKSVVELKGNYKNATWSDVANRSQEVFKNFLASLGTVTDSIKLFAKESIVEVGVTQGKILTALGGIGAAIMLVDSANEVKKNVCKLQKHEFHTPKFKVSLLRTIAKVFAVAFAALYLATFIFIELPVAFALLILSTLVLVFTLAAKLYDYSYVQKTVEA